MILRDDGKLLATITPGDQPNTFRVLSKHIGSITQLPSSSAMERLIPELADVVMYQLNFDLKE